MSAFSSYVYSLSFSAKNTSGAIYPGVPQY